MSSLYCCASIKPFRPQHIQHEAKFTFFLGWAEFPKSASLVASNQELDLAELMPPYAIQLVQQVNYGPLESKRYFIPVDGRDEAFVEIDEDQLIQANFQKLNS
jgi:hypothetical protein